MAGNAGFARDCRAGYILSTILTGDENMSRFRRIEYIKHEGCSSDGTGGTPIPMVAIYDSKRINEKQARAFIQCDCESPYLMLIHKYHYDNLLQPAVAEAKKRPIK